MTSTTIQQYNVRQILFQMSSWVPQDEGEGWKVRVLGSLIEVEVEVQNDDQSMDNKSGNCLHSYVMQEVFHKAQSV